MQIHADAFEVVVRSRGHVNTGSGYYFGEPNYSCISEQFFHLGSGG